MHAFTNFQGSAVVGAVLFRKRKQLLPQENDFSTLKNEKGESPASLPFSDAEAIALPSLIWISPAPPSSPIAGGSATLKIQRFLCKHFTGRRR